MKNERASRTDANLKLDTSPDFVALLSSTLETAFSTFESKKDHTVVSPSCRSSIRATKQCLPTCALQIHFRSQRAISFSGLWKVPQKDTRVVSWTSRIKVLRRYEPEVNLREFAYSVTMHCVTFIQRKQIFHRENNDRLDIFYMQAIANNYIKIYSLKNKILFED